MKLARRSSVTSMGLTRRLVSAPLRTAAAAEDSSPAANPYYPTLFSPLSLHQGRLVLPNRVLMGSMHTGLEGHSIPFWFQRFVLGMDHAHAHADLDAMAQYFVERAEGGVGLMVTGGIAPNREGWTGPFAAKLSTRAEMEHHKVVTEAVHSVLHSDNCSKSRICLQILHTGRYAYHPLAVSASSTKSPITPFTARGLSKAGIHRTIADFVRCASLAQEAGYDGVEVMASEGYLLSQFLSPRTNLRTDEYGGSLENRARMPLEIVRQIRGACGEDFIIIFRLSLLDLVEGGLQWDETVQLAQWLEQAGVSILNTGIGKI
jgi:2,4-dienoyl-CoA reductase (NADPH2)